MKKVTPEQIDRLYEFTRQHYVEYYDVQTELVDHLANAIETHWQEFPDEVFEIVLQKEFRKFGKSGFKQIVSQRKKQLTALYRRVVLQHFKAYLSFPKVLITATMTIGFFILISRFLLDSSYIILYWNGLVLVIMLLYAILIRKKLRNILTKKTKILLQEIFIGNNSFKLLGTIVVVQIGTWLNFNPIKNFLKESYPMLWGASFICALACLFIRIIFYEIPKDNKNQFEEITNKLIKE